MNEKPAGTRLEAAADRKGSPMSFAAGDIPMPEGIRGPDPIAVASPASEKHVSRHPLVGESTVIARHSAQAWLVKKQADR